jgi:plasmid stabilization system protein ParE
MKVHWTAFAVNELKSIFIYHRAVASVLVADNIKKSILQTAKLLGKHPNIGMLEENLIDLNQGHRFTIEGNYKIIYLVVEDEVYITDVFDCRQNPQKIRR